MDLNIIPLFSRALCRLDTYVGQSRLLNIRNMPLVGPCVMVWNGSNILQEAKNGSIETHQRNSGFIENEASKIEFGLVLKFNAH